MSSFRFAEDDVPTEEVQMRLILTATGADGRMQRYGDGRDASLLDKNAAVLANSVYIKLGHGASGVKLYPGSANAHDRRNGVPGVQ